MKKLLLSLLVVGSLFSASAQTNFVEKVKDEAKSEYGSVEVTLGGGGLNSNHENEFGFDFSVSVNPFKQAPSLWVGLNQGFAWYPSFSGSTDINANWSWHLFRELYLNTGWSAGMVYSRFSSEDDGSNQFDIYYRTGPEATLQYYIGENAFIFTGINYDFVTEGKNGVRYSFGIGLVL